MFDLVTRQVSFVSIDAAGTGTGQRVVFLSDATDLVADDDNGFRDVFLAAPHPPPPAPPGP